MAIPGGLVIVLCVVIWRAIKRTRQSDDTGLDLKGPAE
jgi:hypothetical protein